MTIRAKEINARLTDPGQARCEGQRSKLAVSGSCVALGADALWKQTRDRAYAPTSVRALISSPKARISSFLGMSLMLCP